jgi:hypothetical protein
MVWGGLDPDVEATVSAAQQNVMAIEVVQGFYD